MKIKYTIELEETEALLKLGELYAQEHNVTSDNVSVIIRNPLLELTYEDILEIRKLDVIPGIHYVRERIKISLMQARNFVENMRE